MSRFVLIVEPDEDSRGALCELLAECGAEVRAAADVAGVAAAAGKDSPCIVVIACGPREKDKTARFIGSLRTRTETVDTPVVVLTTLNDLSPFDDRTTVLQKPSGVFGLRELVCSAAARCAN